ncbi:hypothetical protein [Flavobacterium sp. KBS0721]|uniref:hypothetical protein n=1 Tax=Flavobacterium sp. KBS0721 TaxID=1179672 RepID=UPI000990274A|nr:hypothetical protein [Flavobacterium sp. KBS0721]QDW20646.1 hypothetical protein B0M43_0011190 [Flavobacterium sp. KBS0721]
MESIEKSDNLQFHYFFKDDSHSINSIVRNECEKEIIYIFKEISETLGLELELETLPTEEGGFKETWKFLGKNSAQISLIVAISAIIISRFPVENKELTKLQIENLKLDNELKRKELEKLNLDFLQDNNEISQETIKDSVELVNKNYKVSWRKSNLYKKLNNYQKVDSIEVLRYQDKKPVGSSRTVLKNEFYKFILQSDELPKLEIENAKIDVISPAIKRGKFRWKGFYDNNIINFLMNDFDFNNKVLNGHIHFSNRYSIEVEMSQERKINQDGNVIVTNTTVEKVKASIEGENRIEY